MPDLEYFVDGELFIDTKSVKNIKTKLLADLGSIVVNGVQRGVDKQVDIRGKRYEKLKDATVKSKVRRGSPTPNTRLMDTGSMVNLVDKKVFESDDMVVISPSGEKNKEIAVYHNEGTKHIPKTEWLGISEETDKEINKRIDTAMDDLVLSIIQG